MQRDVLVTGGTGYIGTRLVTALVLRGHCVRVLTRAGSTRRVVAGATAVLADVLHESSVASALRPGDTIVHLVGTPHPNPSKAEEFRRVDLASIRAVAAPWYVIGQSHWWPVSLIPFYALAALVPWWREGARRLGLVTLSQMVASLVNAVEHPPRSGEIRVVDVTGIRARGNIAR